MPVRVRFGGDLAATRIVLDVDRSVEARVVADGGAGQLILDFPRLSAVPVDGTGRGLAGQWSLERAGAGVRLKIALTHAAAIDRRFMLPPGEGVDYYRYVIDLKPEGADIGVLLASSRQPAPKPVPAKPEKRVIVIDAGHGGHDPGALGAHAQEKDVTLAAARALKAKLEATGRYRVVLTRKDDTFIPLEERVRISRQANADLFISLHADSAGDKASSPRGASVYTLSDKGSDRVARNSANSNWSIDVDLPSADSEVRNILFDLTQRATRNKSAAFAEMLIQNVGAERPLLTRAHRDAGYVVLFAPDVPAVLLEMGFITNAQDEKALTSEAERGKLAEAIAQSIDAYFTGELRTAST